MRRVRGFTLIEIMISVAILVLILALAVPSLVGVIADKRLKRSVNEFSTLVHQAQERSVAEHRAYLIVWNDNGAALRPETFTKDEEARDVAQFAVVRGETLTLSLPSALRKDPPAEWIFWPSGNCEPAIVSYKSANGSWSASYSPLTARGELISYAAR
jgi:type II secretion system protein H